jgi:hypothetical protein
VPFHRVSTAVSNCSVGPGHNSRRDTILWQVAHLEHSSRYHYLLRNRPVAWEPQTPAPEVAGLHGLLDAPPAGSRGEFRRSIAALDEASHDEPLRTWTWRSSFGCPYATKRGIRRRSSSRDGSTEHLGGWAPSDSCQQALLERSVTACQGRNGCCVDGSLGLPAGAQGCRIRNRGTPAGVSIEEIHWTARPGVGRSSDPRQRNRLGEPKLVHRQDRPASASLCDATARHPSPAIMSEGWLATRRTPEGSAQSTVAAGADAGAAMVDTLRVSVNELAESGRPSPAIECEGWLATRSSLMNAGERRVVDLTGIEPVTS